MGPTRFQALAMAGILLAAGPIARAADAPVADAAERSDRAAVRALIERKADVNRPQPDGMTALHWAAEHDDLETARLLIAAKADVRAANRYGVTPLALACTNGDAAMVELFLNAGADPNAALRGHETALMTAARTGRIGPVKALLARGADVNAREWHGQTALMWAAAEGHAEVVGALLKAGADFRTPLPSGFTPMFFAVREGRAEVVRILLQAGADVNEAMQPKRRAARAPRRGTSPLLMAVENGHFELAVALLEAGADPNDQRSGFTPLHAVSWVRKPNRGDGEDGDPAPIGSGTMGSLEFVAKLAKHGADVNARLKRGASGRGILSRVGATPFLLAAATADVPLMKALVKLGADPMLPNAQHATPLMAAAGVGCIAPGEEAGTEDEAIEAVNLAIALGGDVNAVDDNGETAMHGAAYKNFPRVVQLLADRGARVEIWNRENKYGWTPISIAEGHRVGNFKPSPETLAALHRVLERDGHRGKVGMVRPVGIPPGSAADAHANPPRIRREPSPPEWSQTTMTPQVKLTVTDRNGRKCASTGSPWEPIVGYSRAVRAGDSIFVTGTVGLEPDGQFAPSARQQARRALEIIIAAIESLGGKPTDVVRTRIYLSNIEDWKEIGEVHSEFFESVRPATTLVQVARLIDLQALVEIEADAVIQHEPESRFA